MTEKADLLKEAMKALNAFPSHRYDGNVFSMTYRLARALEQNLGVVDADEDPLDSTVLLEEALAALNVHPRFKYDGDKDSYMLATAIQMFIEG